MASPASSVGSGICEMSMRSVSTPARLPISWVTRRAAWRLMRPILAVPKITGMNRGRLASMKLPSAGGIPTGRESDMSLSPPHPVSIPWPADESYMESIVACILGFLATLVDAGTGGAIGFGVLAALVRAARLGLQFKTGLDTAMSEIRITLGRWLALALELALAADILRTVMVPTWDEIGKLGAIVVLRTVLNYFLQREIEQEQQKKAEYVLHDVHA